MIGALAGVVIGVALLIALLAVITAVRDRPMGRALVIALGVLSAGLVVQTVVALMKIGEVGEKATFIGYLAGTLVIPPAAVWWGRAEHSRWGPAVIAVAGFTVAVMTARLLQIWNGTA